MKFGLGIFTKILI